MYKKADFNQCVFNPMAEEPMLNVYPNLAEIVNKSEWEETENLDAIIRYVILVYDPRSPLVANEKDYGQRKMMASQIAGINQDDSTLLDAIFVTEYPGIYNLITEYLRKFAKSKEWAAIQAFESTYWESIKELLMPISGKSSREILDAVQKKSAIKQEVVLDIKRLEEFNRSFYGMDEEIIKRKKTTPEMIALR